MDKIDLYVHTDIRTTKRSAGCYIYILEYQTQKGPATLTGKATHIEDATFLRAELVAINEGLKRLKRPVSVVIHAEGHMLILALQNKWFETWQSRGWKNSKGEDIDCLEDWQEFTELMKDNELITATKDKHSYLSWMAGECERAV